MPTVVIDILENASQAVIIYKFLIFFGQICNFILFRNLMLRILLKKRKTQVHLSGLLSGLNRFSFGNLKFKIN